MIHIEKTETCAFPAAVFCAIDRTILRRAAARAQTRDIGVHGEMLDR